MIPSVVIFNTLREDNDNKSEMNMKKNNPFLP